MPFESLAGDFLCAEWPWDLPFSFLPMAIAFPGGILPFVFRRRFELSLILSLLPAQEDDGFGAD